jgi:hypothetical protein
MRIVTNKNPRLSMDIYSKPGTKVVYDSATAGYPFDQEKIKKHGLILGGIYTVNFTVVHSSSTDVYLVEFPGVYFNSVCFGETN